MPLKVDLKPGDKFIFNGSVVSVGKDGRSLILQNEAVLLRDKDVMQEDEANTPAKRIYFSIMCMYIDPNSRNAHETAFHRLTEELMEATTLSEIKRSLILIERDVAGGNYYRALKTCKVLITAEAEILKIVQP